MVESQSAYDTNKLSAPFAPYAAELGALEPALIASEVPFLAQVTVRVEPGTEAHAAIGAALGCELLTSVGAVSGALAGGSLGHAGTSAIWLGPDEWLLLAAPGRAADVETALRAALVRGEPSATAATARAASPRADASSAESPAPLSLSTVGAIAADRVDGADSVAIVDVSGQRTAIDLGGERLVEILSKAVSTDVSQLRAGSSLQTIWAQTGAILIGTDELDGDFDDLDAGTFTPHAPIASVRVLVRASFARYFAQWLVDACVEYVPGVTFREHAASRLGF